MAIKRSISKIDSKKKIRSKLPRFNLDLRLNNTKIVMLYVPITETLIRMWKEKKGIVEIVKKQFNEFEVGSPRKQNLKIKTKTKTKKTR